MPGARQRSGEVAEGWEHERARPPIGGEQRRRQAERQDAVALRRGAAPQERVASLTSASAEQASGCWNTAAATQPRKASGPRAARIRERGAQAVPQARDQPARRRLIRPRAAGDQPGATLCVVLVHGRSAYGLLRAGGSSARADRPGHRWQRAAGDGARAQALIGEASALDAQPVLVERGSPSACCRRPACCRGVRARSTSCGFELGLAGQRPGARNARARGAARCARRPAALISAAPPGRRACTRASEREAQLAGAAAPAARERGQSARPTHSASPARASSERSSSSRRSRFPCTRSPAPRGLPWLMLRPAASRAPR
jgi:hypothetical protein